MSLSLRTHRKAETGGPKTSPFSALGCLWHCSQQGMLSNLKESVLLFTPKGPPLVGRGYSAPLSTRIGLSYLHGQSTRRWKTEPKHKVLPRFNHLFTLSVARAKIPTARCAPTKSAI